MGCTKSKLSKDVCLADETPAMHTKYIKENGLKKYYLTMGMPPQGPAAAAPGAETEDSSSNLNLGFINIEEKSTTENNNSFYGLTVSDVLEVSIGFCLFLYLFRLIYRQVMRRRKQAKQSKSLEMQEIVKSAHQTHQTFPAQKTHFQIQHQAPKTVKTPMDYAIQTIHQQPQTMLPMFGQAEYQID